MPKTTVLLADDHTVVAEGLRSLLESRFDLVGIVHDGRALLEAVGTLSPDVVVTDISMPLLNGIEAIRQIRALRPGTKILVLTMHRDTEMAIEAFRAGASGYMLKISPGEELMAAISSVSEGRPYAAAQLGKDVITLLMEAGRRSGEGSTPLTPRQREVLQLIAEGRTMKEVATILGISPRTAESHKYEIMQVLGVNTTAAMIQYAIRLKIAGDET